MAVHRASFIKSFVVPTALFAGIGRILIDFLAKLSATGPLFYYSTFFISFILEIFLIVYITKKFKKGNNNLLHLREGLKIAVATMVLIGLLFAIYSFVYNNYINPSFQTETAIAWGDLFGQGEAVREEISKNESNNAPFGIFYVMLQFSFLGFVIGMVVSSILKTRQNLN